MPKQPSWARNSPPSSLTVQSTAITAPVTPFGGAFAGQVVFTGVVIRVFFSWRIRQIWRIWGNSAGYRKKFRPVFRQILEPDGIQGYPNHRQVCSQKNNGRYCVSPNCHCQKNSAAQTTLARGLLSSLATAWPATTPGPLVKSC